MDTTQLMKMNFFRVNAELKQKDKICWTCSKTTQLKKEYATYENCYVCKADNKCKWGQDGPFCIYTCHVCGLKYVTPRLNDQELNNLYNAPDRRWQINIKEYYEPTLEFRMKSIYPDRIKLIENKLKSKGKILDFGCNVGGFLKVAKDTGWDVYGIEVNKYAASQAIKRLSSPDKIHCGDLTDLNVPKNFFDVITLWDVIEHLTNPNEILQSCYHFLSDDGIIVIDCPNSDSFEFNYLHDKSVGVSGDIHLSYFNQESIQFLLKQNNFEIIDFSTFGLDIAHIIREYRIENEDHSYKLLQNLQEHLQNVIDSAGQGCYLRVIAKKNTTTPYVPVNKGQQCLDTPEREERFNKNRALGNEKAYQINRKQWEFNPKNKIIPLYPLHVDIETSSVCNLNCPMCYTRTETFKKNVEKGFMDEFLFKKLVDECVQGKVYSIRLSLRGEAFLHPQIIEFIEYAKKKGIQEVSSLTNGSMLTPDFSEKLVRSGIDWITVSIDGVDEMYESIRKPMRFKQIVSYLTELNNIKRKNKLKKPVIKIQGIWPAVSRNPEKYLQIFTPISDVIYVNSLIDFLHKDVSQSKVEFENNFSCPQLYQRLVITSNGMTRLCANDSGQEMFIGDANTQSIFELWHSDQIKNARNSHANFTAMKDIPICSKCHLPRKTESEEINIAGRTLFIKKYTGRSQIIGC